MRGGTSGNRRSNWSWRTVRWEHRTSSRRRSRSVSAQPGSLRRRGRTTRTRSPEAELDKTHLQRRDSRARETPPQSAPAGRERRLQACRSASSERQASRTRRTAKVGRKAGGGDGGGHRGRDGVAPPAREVKGFAQFLRIPVNRRDSACIHRSVRAGHDAMLAAGISPRFARVLRLALTASGTPSSRRCCPTPIRCVGREPRQRQHARRRARPTRVGSTWRTRGACTQRRVAYRTQTMPSDGVCSASSSAPTSAIEARSASRNPSIRSSAIARECRHFRCWGDSGRIVSPALCACSSALRPAAVSASRSSPLRRTSRICLAPLRASICGRSPLGRR